MGQKLNGTHQLLVYANDALKTVLCLYVRIKLVQQGAKIQYHIYLGII
jgi:hypothetical protein